MTSIIFDLHDAPEQILAIDASGGQVHRVRADFLEHPEHYEDDPDMGVDTPRLFVNAASAGLFGTTLFPTPCSAELLEATLDEDAARGHWRLQLCNFPSGGFRVLHNLLMRLEAEVCTARTVSPRTGRPLSRPETLAYPPAPSPVPFTVDPDIYEWNKDFLVRIGFGRALTDPEASRVQYALEQWMYLAGVGAYAAPSDGISNTAAITEIYHDVDDTFVIDLMMMASDDAVWDALLLLGSRLCADGIPVTSFECE